MGTKVTSEVNYQELYEATTATPTKMSHKKYIHVTGFLMYFVRWPITNTSILLSHVVIKTISCD